MTTRIDLLLSLSSLSSFFSSSLNWVFSLCVCAASKTAAFNWVSSRGARRLQFLLDSVIQSAGGGGEDMVDFLSILLYFSPVPCAFHIHYPKVTQKELISAAEYLNNTLGKEGVQELISNLSKDRVTRKDPTSVVEYLNNTLGKEGVQELISNISKYRGIT